MSSNAGSSSSSGSSRDASHISSTHSNMAFPELIALGFEFERFATRLSTHLRSLGERLDVWDTRANIDRARIDGLERNAAHADAVEALEARQREDHAHIEVLERKVEALSSEVRFLRQERLGSVGYEQARVEEDVNQPVANSSRRESLNVESRNHSSIVKLPVLAASSKADIKIEADDLDLQTTPKGKGKQPLIEGSISKRSSFAGRSRPSVLPLVKTEDVETIPKGKAKLSVAQRATSTKASTIGSSGSSGSGTIKPIKKEPTIVDLVTPMNEGKRLKVERTSSWVEQTSSSSSSSSTLVTLTNDAAVLDVDTTPRGKGKERATVERSTSWDMVLTDDEELAELSALSHELGLDNSFSTSATKVNEEEDAAEEPPVSDCASDSSSSDDEFFEPESVEDNEDDQPSVSTPFQAEYKGIHDPPHTSPVAIGPLQAKTIFAKLKLPRQEFKFLREFVRCTEPRFHAFFHEDLAFLYNPFTVELEASSVICGWASEEHIQQDTEYIEDHVNPEGRVYHTFVLYGLKAWWYLGAMVWKPSGFRCDWSHLPEEDHRRFYKELSRSWNRGLRPAEVADALESGELYEYCVELSRPPDAKEASMNFAKFRLRHIKPDCENIWR
ncbi:unnamed protein product [Somion occarium]|uniref:Uncharacterized protein n=1 Tax=Somion occarium TaxID=3059160 RepID=A0ABP1D1Y7_9APHY